MRNHNVAEYVHCRAFFELNLLFILFITFNAIGCSNISCLARIQDMLLLNAVLYLCFYI